MQVSKAKEAKEKNNRGGKKNRGEWGKEKRIGTDE